MSNAREAETSRMDSCEVKSKSLGSTAVTPLLNADSTSTTEGANAEVIDTIVSSSAEGFEVATEGYQKKSAEIDKTL